MMVAITQLEHAADRQARTHQIAKKFIERLGDPSRWTYLGECIELDQPTGRCVCDHPIRYLFPIYGPNAGETAMVGSECIENFAGYNPELYNQLTAAKEQLERRIADAVKAAREARQKAEANYHTEENTQLRNIARSRMRHYREHGTRLPESLYRLSCEILAGIPRYKRVSSYAKSAS